ncbi:MAG: NUDIX hydrolase [Spirochaetes bacterium]|nr:NUDIX hydrolase [Spirochaetota bacterium]
MDINKTWKIQNEKSVLKTRIYEVFDLKCYLPSKKIKHNFYSIRMPDWVNVFSVTTDKKIIFVKQHRIGKNIITLEAPAGAIDKGEAPKNAALRELEEETGYVPDKLILLKKISVNPAIQNNTCYIFLALDCRKTKETKFDHSEELDIVFHALNELNKIINSDMIDNSLAYMACLLAKNYFKL